MTTTMMGAVFANDGRTTLDTFEQWAIFFLMGGQFSLPLMAILLAHEMGHYIAGRRSNLNITPPYFIPCPPVGFWGVTVPLPGTFGAFIKIRSLITDRNALIKVGACGPLAGSLVAIPMLALGIFLSKATPQVAAQQHPGISLGSSLILELMYLIRFGDFSSGQVIFLHPTALAAWFGLFVTAINLLPMGQLDGGHVLYALVGPQRARTASLVVLACLIPLGIFFWPGWLFFGVLVTVLGLKHPPPLDSVTPLDSSGKLLGWATVILFSLVFIPVPFSV